MKTLEEVNEWIQGAIAEFGDPALPIGPISAQADKSLLSS